MDATAPVGAQQGLMAHFSESMGECCSATGSAIANGASAVGNGLYYTASAIGSGLQTAGVAIGSGLQTAGVAIGDGCSAFGTMLVNGASATCECLSATWENTVYPALQAIYTFVVGLFAKIGDYANAGMDWVQQNPEKAQIGFFSCIIGTAVGIFTHYICSKPAAAQARVSRVVQQL